MRRKLWLLTFVLAACGAAQAQWEMENSGTTADLRGIDNVGGGVAWASGTNGTVLRTEDGGYLWQACAVPPGAEHLDFRGVQAFDANTANVMSSGKGDLSRLYKTTDGCQTWKLVFTNPDADGFWDGLIYIEDDDVTFIPRRSGTRAISIVLGYEQRTHILGQLEWTPDYCCSRRGSIRGEQFVLIYNLGDGMFSFITGGTKPEIIHEEHGIDARKGMYSEWSRNPLPFPAGPSGGAFSVAARPYIKERGRRTTRRHCRGRLS